MNSTLRFPLILTSALSLFCCLNNDEDSGEKGNNPAQSQAKFSELLFNAKWYRTLGSASSIQISAGELLFAWILKDTSMVADSFYIGIDTLWLLPQEEFGGVKGNRWDLQVCPNEHCIKGVNDQIFGGNATVPFNADMGFEGEHHFQFIPAIDPEDLVNLPYIAPEGAITGGMMYAKSRTNSTGDTVFAFGAWQMPWDENHPPPLRPVNGYLPKKTDFEVVEGKVRYTGP